MDLYEVFKMWDESRAKRKSKFKLLKAPAIIEPKDPPYKKSVQMLMNHRLERNLSIEDIANALGIDRVTVSGIENFTYSENWLYVYALSFIFMRYEEHLLSRPGIIYSSDITQ